MSRRNPAGPTSENTAAYCAQYPLPWGVGIKLIWSALWGKKRDFSTDARACLSLLDQPVEILGKENIPQQGPCLISANHYSRPGFQAWWIGIAISTCLPFEVHWVMTDAWRFENRPFSRQLEAITRWGFRCVAQVYGFSLMPPMPPRAEETLLRAQSMRHLLRFARKNPCPVIGLVPEGHDSSGGLLGIPPPGVGRLVSHLMPHTRFILPAAVYETRTHLCLKFGEPFIIHTSSTTNPDFIDRQTSDALMHAIASLLPSHLRGVYL